MKTIRQNLFLLAALVALAGVLPAKTIPGPRGGRILTAEAPHAEFLVQADRTVRISFYDADLKPLAVAAQVVSATAETEAGKVRLDFAAKDGALVSTAPLPAGEGYRVVVQLRETAGAKPQNFRLELHSEQCGECQRAEYACTCEGH